MKNSRISKIIDDFEQKRTVIEFQYKAKKYQFIESDDNKMNDTISGFLEEYCDASLIVINEFLEKQQKRDMLKRLLNKRKRDNRVCCVITKRGNFVWHE